MKPRSSDLQDKSEDFVFPFGLSEHDLLYLLGNIRLQHFLSDHPRHLGYLKNLNNISVKLTFWERNVLICLFPERPLGPRGSANRLGDGRYIWIFMGTQRFWQRYT